MRVGKFELLDELGAGAFGTVYKALDTELQRTVAIKLPRSGNVASREDVDRFLREARSAAQLQHPNIVSVFDAGQSDDTCWLVSEYIQGETLSDRLQRTRYSFRDAAQRIVEVADAVHYAHQRGVVHRDLKPSNIMLDLDGRPHVMDFGLAKRDAGEITMTLDGQVLGTPAYMSPEQARGEAHTVDARSDVYSLGVILYELLTGELPFRGNKRMLMVQVLQDEPRPPRRLNDHISRDLETITLKCMAKEPGRRYETAAELADDLKRWLNNEPILARPVGNTQRVWRWARRNPRVAVLGAMVLTLLLLITIGSSIAAALLSAANSREHQALRAVQEQKARADANFKVARDAVDRYYLQVSDSQELKEQGLEQLRRDLLSTAVEFYRNFIEQDSDDLQVRGEQAKAYKNLASITADIDSKEKAIELFRQAIPAYERLAREHPGELDYELEVATAQNNIGQTLLEMGRFREAEVELLKGLEIRRGAVRDHPEVPHAGNDLAASYNVLGLVYRSMSRIEDSEKSFLEALKIREQLAADRPDDPRYQSDLGKVYSNLANFYRAMGKPVQARAMLEKDLAIMEGLIEAHPTDQDYQLELSNTCNNLAILLRAMGVVDQAEGMHARALTIRKRLVETHPAVTQYQSELALSHYNLGNLYRGSQRMKDAEAAYQDALVIRELLVQKHPRVAPYRQALANSYNSLGILYRETKRYSEADVAYSQALALRLQLSEEQPNSSVYLQDLAAVHGNRGNLLSDMERTEDAEEAYQQALTIKERLVEQHANIPSFRQDLGDAHHNFGIFCQQASRVAAAEDAFQQAISVFKTLVSNQPDSLPARQSLANSQTMLATLYQESGRIEQAQTLLLTTLADQEELSRRRTEVVSLQLDLADTLCMLGHLHRDTKKFEPAIPWYDRSLAALRPFISPENQSHRVKLAARRAFRGRAFCLAQLDRHAEALPSWTSTLEFEEGSVRDWDDLQLARSLFHLGEREKAITRVEDIVKRSQSDGQMLWEAARVLSVAAKLASVWNLPKSDEEQVIASYATRAFECLRRANELEFFKTTAAQQELQNDKDLDTLRGREDFESIFGQK